MPQQSEIPSGQQGEENFVCLLEDNARRLGAKPALLWDGGALSWAELDQRASGFAHFLAAKGAGPGDRIATLIPNHWSFAVALLGILKLGATAATLHPTLKPTFSRVCSSRTLRLTLRPEPRHWPGALAPDFIPRA